MALCDYPGPSVRWLWKMGEIRRYFVASESWKDSEDHQYDRCGCSWRWDCRGSGETLVLTKEFQHQISHFPEFLGRLRGLPDALFPVECSHLAEGEGNPANSNRDPNVSVADGNSENPAYLKGSRGSADGKGEEGQEKLWEEGF